MQINTNQLFFRKANLSEVNLLVEYRIRFLREFQGEQSEENEAYLHEQLNAYFREAIENETFVAFFAEYEQMTIGFSGMMIQSIPGNFNLPDGRQGNILNMYMLPDFRRNGICTKLIELLIKEGKRIGLQKFLLHTSDDRLELYKQYGFKESDLPELELIQS